MAAERRDYVALEWVAGEIAETLKQSIAELDAYLENRADVTRLRFCLTYIHQVFGTLKMVEFAGAALLAEEMEAVAQALVASTVVEAQRDDALLALKTALDSLPNYLQRLLVQRRDAPALLLPLINDLRAVRGEVLITESAIFSPDFTSKIDAAAQPTSISAGELHEVAKKLRQMYQMALLNYLRNNDPRQNLNYLAKVCARLSKLAAARPSEALWKICIALCEGLLNRSIQPTATVKLLLRQVDSQLKALVEHGEQALQAAPPIGLLKNLLYYIAASGASSRYIAEIKQTYNLPNALPAETELVANAADDDATVAVKAALAQQLADLARDLPGLSGDKNLIVAIKRVQDTAALLGMTSAQATLQELVQRARGGRLDIVAAVRSLHQLAESLELEWRPTAPRPLFNDSEEAQEQLDKAFDAVMHESRNSLEQAKEAIIEFVATQWRHQCLEDVPELLAGVRGSFAIAGLNRAAAVLAACENYVRDDLLKQRKIPAWQLLDTLADAIASVDYYVERLSEDAAAECEGILDIAEESVAALAAEPLAAPVAPVGAQVIPFLRPGVASAEFDDETGFEEGAADEQPVPESAPADDIQVADAAVAMAPTAVAEVAATVSDEEALDQEIIDIFIEEAGEVLDTIAEYLPQWREQPNDHETLSVIRRAFHTLKGSGRMVGAIELGELAWSVENMLNRVMDNSLNIDAVRIATAAEAAELLPAMVTAFEQQRANSMAPVEALMGRAYALAKEQTPLLATADAAIPFDTIPDFIADTAPDIALQSELADDYREPLEPTAESDEDDSVLLDIFIAEAASHLQVVEEFVEHATQLAGPAELSDELQRALHTLKGSAHMADVAGIARVVTPVERLVKELRAAQLKADPDVMAVLAQCVQMTRAALTELGGARHYQVPGAEDFELAVEALHYSRLALVDSEPEQAGGGISPAALNQFLSDAAELIAGVSDDIASWRDRCLDDQRQHTLAATISQVADSAEALNLAPVVDLAQALQTLLRIGADHPAPGERFYMLALVAAERLIDMLDRLAANQRPDVDNELLNTLQEFEFSSESEQSAFADIPLLEDVVELLAPPMLALNDSESPPEAPIAALFDEYFVEPTEEEPVAFAVDSGVRASDDYSLIDEHLEDLLSTEASVPPQLAEAKFEPLAEMPASEVASEQPEAAFVSSEATQQKVDIDRAEPLQAFQSGSAAAAPNAESSDDDDEIDAEILEIFIEEAGDLLESIDEAIHHWSSDRDSAVYLDDLQRLLHTLKGGARLAGLKNLGNLSHNFETQLINSQQQGRALDDALLAEVQTYQDQLIRLVDAVKQHGHGGDDLVAGQAKSAIPPEVESRPEMAAPLTIELDDSEQLLTDELEVASYSTEQRGKDESTAAKILAFTRPKAVAEPFAAPSLRETESLPELSGVAQQLRRGPQEVVKISAQLLEQLVNLAGETSIARSRAEEQVNEFVFSLDEMQITVDRLQQQVRRLDLETEAQMLFRQEQVENEGLEGFDPLEFDRYSLLQQLSRSLLESASDLIDIKNTLAEKSRDMETLLVQQSRINTELQEGLMRSRMVPFARMVPRLRRIVRQVAGELDKQVELYVDNAEGELDRTVLERIVPPLEHMLRNALDHGVESEAERMAAAKPVQGTIVLSVTREGADVVLTLADDGRGIDLEAVRAKAIARGLMESGANLTDHEVMQFILQSGFSTAKQVTQISGRGVGMDVVYSEIKQLGGHLEIDSAWGKGTRFTIRLPFTVSVNRALMVSGCGDVYAIPLNTIEGIVRVSPFELEAYYQPDAPLFEYAGQPYLMRYIGALLHTSDKPNLEAHTTPLPVLLVRGSDHAVAIQVDSLMGSREIVVKTLGPQFSTVQGLSGATVLGDGSVVVILDLLTMIRADASHLHRDLSIGHEELHAERDRPLLVMVVDDSVTVRKVTSRFLERQGMEVILAKDGIDAINLLQDSDRVPDVMLLDIEMPRMDGFEVASRIRHTSRLQHLPIIMITSRTGDKHRDRAMSLGVNKYLGKPYQEKLLLETIQELTGTVFVE